MTFEIFVPERTNGEAPICMTFCKMASNEPDSWFDSGYCIDAPDYVPAGSHHGYVNSWKEIVVGPTVTWRFS